ncbi:MAG: hypothetical protein HY835_03250 [Anaerolineae bacterium]|nr:hypothetical protein [Anaerolineae bacterium]
MRITRETLLKIARDTAAERVRVSRRLVCIYLVGSCLTDEPLLGGTTDIDLVMVHDSEPLQQREIVRLSDEVHLDISHYSQEMFRQPRHLRVHPWLGPVLYSKPLVLHDSNHWFDYAQAATGAQFLMPDNVLARSRSLAGLARQSWMQLSFNPEPDHRRRVYAFLKAVENAGNAIASLGGLPLTERRFLVQLPQRAAGLGRPDLSSNLAALLAGEAEVSDETWAGWLAQGDQAFQAASQLPDVPIRLNPARRAYALRAASSLWEKHPSAAFWLLFRTWTLAASHLPSDSPAVLPWQEACQVAGLDKAHFSLRLEALDAYLDSVEEALDVWGQQHGAGENNE